MAGFFTTLDYGSFSSSCRVVWLTSSSRMDSAMRGSSISFLTRASVAWLDSCFGSFKYIPARFHESKGITSQFGTGLAVSELFSYRAVLNSLYQSAKCSISNVKQRAPFTRSEGYPANFKCRERLRILGERDGASTAHSEANRITKIKHARGGRARTRYNLTRLSAIKATRKPCKRWPHLLLLLSTGDPRPPDVALGCTPS